MILYGKPVAEELKKETQDKAKILGLNDKYMAILFFGDNKSSEVYVNNKQKYGEEIGIKTIVFGQNNKSDFGNFPYLAPYTENLPKEKDQILELIKVLNRDKNCIGIMIQLPLPEDLTLYKTEFLEAICPEKDIDGLGGTLVGKSFFGMIDFMPATPKAVMTLLKYYNLDDVKNKKVAVIGQSTIVGKPLALELLKRGAQVAVFDITNTEEEIKSYTKKCSYIFSATGQTRLIDDTYLGENKDQIVIDIGYGHKDGKAVGDVNFQLCEKKVLHISPVPGGVGPLTIACLFSNIISLQEIYGKNDS